MKNVIKVLVFTTAVAGLAIVGPAPSASAHTGQGNATPANDGRHPWSENGCSTPLHSVNSVRGVYNFRHACAHHDGCYGGFPVNGRATYWTSRAQCDSWFSQDMQASCRWQHGANPNRSISGRACLSAATTYYKAVRTFGGSRYRGPRNN